MVTIVKFIIGILLGGMLVTSCNNNTSLQEYLVDKQEDDNFVKMDLATSLFYAADDKLSVEQKEVLKTIKKINFVGYPIKGDQLEYSAEHIKLKEILDQERYQTLSEIKYKNFDLTFKFTGEVDAVDEVILLVNDDDKGFAVFRMIGDNMEPSKMYKLIINMDKNDINLSALEGIEALF